MNTKIIFGSVVAAAFALTGVATAQNAASVVARAIEVHSSAKDAVHQMDSEGGNWEYDWADLGSGEIDVFDTYFTISGPSNPPGGVLNAKKNAFTVNACNFWCGAPLQSATHIQAGNTWIATPKPTYTGDNAPDPHTGWTMQSDGGGEGGGPEPIIISIDDLFIAEQKVLHHRPKPKGNRPWHTKISFDLLPADVSDLKIEIVVEDDEDFEPILLLDPLLEHEYSSEYADWIFQSGGLQWGNPDALAHVVNGAYVSEILQGIVGGDDFHGNNNETGGLRVRITPVVPLNYIVTAAGDYTLRISGTVRGNSLDGTSDQSFQVTLSSTAVDPCPCDE